MQTYVLSEDLELLQLCVPAHKAWGPCIIIKCLINQQGTCFDNKKRFVPLLIQNKWSLMDTASMLCADES